MDNEASQASPKNIQQVAASQLELLSRYYNSVLLQVRTSFRWAITAAITGLLFFLAAISFLLLVKETNVSYISLISGALLEGISAINFYLYGRATNQLTTYQERVNEIQRYLLGIEKLTEADPGDIQQIAASQFELGTSYYTNVLLQSKQSFQWALRAAIVGLLFFLASVVFLLLKQPSEIAYVSLISGALIEIISGVNFYLYGRASDQLGAFHIRLDRMQRFLIANSACEKIEGETKHSTRSEIIKLIVEVPSVKSGKDVTVK